MLYYLLLLCLPVTSCLQSISQKQYNLKYEKNNVKAPIFEEVTG